MEGPSKIGGAASPDCSGKEGDSAKSQLSRKNKNVSPFCDDCRQVEPTCQFTSFRQFVDRQGFMWFCFKPLTCPHAIVLNGAIASCRVRTAQLNQAEKEMPL